MGKISALKSLRASSPGTCHRAGYRRLSATRHRLSAAGHRESANRLMRDGSVDAERTVETIVSEPVAIVDDHRRDESEGKGAAPEGRVKAVLVREAVLVRAVHESVVAV